MNGRRTTSQRLNLQGKRIGVFGKGGSGKSTSVVLLATGLRQCGYEVCILDADSTNIGLSRALGIEQPPVPLMEYFGGMVFSGGRVTCPVDDPTPLADSEISLEDLPPQYYRQNEVGITLLVLGKIGEMGPGAGCDGPVSKIARDLKISNRGETPVTLLDFKAGFEDTARGVITNLDWAIVIVDPTIAAMEMAANMRDMIHQIKNGQLPATQHLESTELVMAANKLFTEARIIGALFLLNKIRDAETEVYLREKLAERGIEPNGVLLEDPSISISWLKGIPVSLEKSQTEILDFIEKLEVAERVDSSWNKTLNDQGVADG
jgi:CO dehydrogenase nickel-insertion accessory protein CooC1